MDPVQQLLKIPQMGPEEHASSEDIVRQQGINYSLKNKISIVTGAASGMGVATASSLASLGSKVYILDRDVDKVIILICINHIFLNSYLFNSFNRPKLWLQKLMQSTLKVV